MPYVPPHLRNKDASSSSSSSAAAGRSLASLASGWAAAASSDTAREGRLGSLGGGDGGGRWGGGGGGDRWGDGSGGGGGDSGGAWGGSGGGGGRSYSNNRSREDRSYEYRQDAGAPCVYPDDEQGGVGECFGTVVRREASEHPVLSAGEVATIAAAASAAAALATGDAEHDGEKGSEEPFFDAFLTAAVPTEGTDLFAKLASFKQRLARQGMRFCAKKR